MRRVANAALFALVLAASACATSGGDGKRVDGRCIDDCNSAAVTCLTWRSQSLCQAQQTKCVQRCGK